jgi:hypothetical protein
MGPGKPSAFTCFLLDEMGSALRRSALCRKIFADKPNISGVRPG